MPVEVLSLFKAASLAVGAAKYLGIVQDKLALKLDQLAGSECEAGVRALEQAGQSEKEEQSLLREARNRFNKAISLEKGLRLAMVHLGLAFCHWRLGDRTNAKASLIALMKVNPPTISTAAIVLDTAGELDKNVPWWTRPILTPTFPLPIGPLASYAAERLKRPVLDEQGELADLKHSVETCLQELSA